jgi:hypothetical protein
MSWVIRVPPVARSPTCGVLVLDLIYVAAIIALFAAIGLIAKGVEKL